MNSRRAFQIGMPALRFSLQGLPAPSHSVRSSSSLPPPEFPYPCSARRFLSLPVLLPSACALSSSGNLPLIIDTPDHGYGNRNQNHNSNHNDQPQQIPAHGNPPFPNDSETRRFPARSVFPAFSNTGSCFRYLVSAYHTALPSAIFSSRNINRYSSFPSGFSYSRRSPG